MNAAKRALELQKLDGSKVVVFHSVIHHLSEINPSFSLPSSTSGAVSLIIHESYIETGRSILKKVENLFKEANQTVEARLLFDIMPEDYIKKIVEEEKFDLVILGCRGDHSKLKRTFLGTIPDKVINEALCDVLIVR
jgi:nucleotide-binding universal stress UspA family protein